MNILNAVDKTRMPGPDDASLRQGGGSPEWAPWIQRWTLLSLTLDAVQKVRWTEKDRELAAHSAYRFQPTVMLAVLTYCHLTGTDRPRKIPSRVAADEALQCLCSGWHPGWEEIRKFRLAHRGLLRRSVLATRRLAARYRLVRLGLRPAVSRSMPAPASRAGQAEPGARAGSGPGLGHRAPGESETADFHTPFVSSDPFSKRRISRYR